jgi:hypothetical protein
MARQIHSSEGVVLYSEQVSFGTAVTPAEPIGVVEYNATDDGDLRQFFTVGSKNLHKNQGGIARVDWQVRSPGISNKEWLQLALRDPSSKELPWLTWGFGSDVPSAREGWQVQDCKVNTLEFTLDGGGVISAGLQGIGRKKTALNTMVPDAGDSYPMMAWMTVTTIGGAAFENLSIRFNVNHNLNMETVNRGAAPVSGEERLWDYLTEGNEEIEGTVRVSRANATDFQAACPTEAGDVVIAIVDPCDGTRNFEITLSDVQFLRQIRNMPQQGWADFELPFNAKGWLVA